MADSNPPRKKIDFDVMRRGVQRIIERERAEKRAKAAAKVMEKIRKLQTLPSKIQFRPRSRASRPDPWAKFFKSLDTPDLAIEILKAADGLANQVRLNHQLSPQDIALLNETQGFFQDILKQHPAQDSRLLPQALEAITPICSIALTADPNQQPFLQDFVYLTDFVKDHLSSDLFLTGKRTVLSRKEFDQYLAGQSRPWRNKSYFP